jgi:hypothetical protein
VIDVPAAQAIPAFARREGMPCQMCHFRLPELNKDGHDYARRGLREEPPGAMGSMKGSGKTEMGGMQMGTPSKAPAGAMGGMEAGKTDKGGMQKDTPSTAPVAATRRSLGEPLPIDWAKYLTVMGHHMFVAATHEQPLFDAGVIDLWAAGPLDPNWTGLANPSFNIQQGGSDVDQAYGQYVTHWADRFGSGRFGQLLPFAILFNQGGPKMPLTDPLILSTPGDTGYGWTPESLTRGLEVGAVNLSRATVYLGTGQPKLEDTVLTSQPGFARHNDFYGTAEWIFTKKGDSLTVYGYHGSAWLSPAASDRSFHRVGFFGNVYGHSTKATLGYLTGSDEDAVGRSLGNSGYFALVEQLLSDRWAAYGRYDQMRRDQSAGGTQTLSGPAIGVSWWAQTQVRLTFEGQFLSRTGGEHENRFMSELLWAF